MVMIADMIVPLDCVDAGGWVDLTKWTGRSWKTISTSYREPYEGVTHVSTLAWQLGDLNCDPRSGGVAGHAHVCEFYGVGPQQFARSIAPTLPFLRWLGDIPVSNVSSVRADGLNYQESVRTTHCRNLVQYAPTSCTAKDSFQEPWA